MGVDLKTYGLGILRGMALTLKHFFKKPITVEYPEVQVGVSERIRGYEFHWYEDRCTGCSLCAKACPNGVITVVASPDPTGKLGKRIIERYDMDLSICLYCGLCVEACPFYAIFMGSEIEKATYWRKDMLWDKFRLTELLKARLAEGEPPEATVLPAPGVELGRFPMEWQQTEQPKRLRGGVRG